MGLVKRPKKPGPGLSVSNAAIWGSIVVGRRRNNGDCKGLSNANGGEKIAVDVHSISLIIIRLK
jgi:hypothetical protein